MNDLSLLLWLGDISGSFSNFLTVLTMIFGILAGIATVVGLIMEGDTDYSSDNIALGIWLKKMGLRVFLPSFIVAGVFSTLLPSKETVYLIAASEVGEAAVVSPTGQRAIDALNRYLDDIGEEKEEDK